MNGLTQKLALALACAGMLSAAEKSGEPSTASRTVSYHETDIIPIATEIRFTTLIELPKEETIMEVTCGDKENWPVNWTGNLAYIKSAKPGSRTNINLITTSGNVYSLLASEVSETAGAHADLKIFLRPVDSSGLIVAKDKPRYVSADAVEGYKKAAEQATQQLQAQQTAAQKQLERTRTEIEANYPATIRHDYKFSVGKNNPFNVSAIYHDDRFMYIEAKPEETPAVYEVKDGKPSLIQYEFKAGRYTIPKILDEGLLRVGKNELRFHRES